jgi:hypothetical protein
MYLNAELVPDPAARGRRGRAWLMFGASVLAAGLTMQAIERERSAAARRLAQQQEAVAARQREGEATRGDSDAVRGQRQRERQDQYRRTFPLNDVLAALESLRGVQARSLALTVDEGLVRLDLAGADAESLAVAVAALERGLGDWDVLLQRQARDGGRLVASVELRDRLREKTWMDR